MSYISRLQKQPPDVFYKRGALKNIEKLIGKRICPSLFLIKLQAWPAALLKKRLWHYEIFKNTFFYRTPPNDNFCAWSLSKIKNFIHDNFLNLMASQKVNDTFKFHKVFTLKSYLWSNQTSVNRSTSMKVLKFSEKIMVRNSYSRVCHWIDVLKSFIRFFEKHSCRCPLLVIFKSTTLLRKDSVMRVFLGILTPSLWFTKVALYTKTWQSGCNWRLYRLSNLVIKKQPPEVFYGQRHS